MLVCEKLYFSTSLINVRNRNYSLNLYHYRLASCKNAYRLNVPSKQEQSGWKMSKIEKDEKTIGNLHP